MWTRWVGVFVVHAKILLDFASARNVESIYKTGAVESKVVCIWFDLVKRGGQVAKLGLIRHEHVCTLE